MGAFDANKFSTVWMYITFAVAGASSIACLVYAIVKIKERKELEGSRLSFIEIVILILSPYILSYISWFIAMTGHLGLDIFLILIICPLILFVAHQLSFLIMSFIVEDEGTRNACQRIAVYSFFLMPVGIFVLWLVQQLVLWKK